MKLGNYRIAVHYTRSGVVSERLFRASKQPHHAQLRSASSTPGAERGNRNGTNLASGEMVGLVKWHRNWHEAPLELDRSQLDWRMVYVEGVGLKRNGAANGHQAGEISPTIGVSSGVISHTKLSVVRTLSVRMYEYDMQTTVARNHGIKPNNMCNRDNTLFRHRNGVLPENP